MIYMDMIISILQSLFCVNMINYCMDKPIRNNKKLIIYIILFSSIIIMIPKITQSILLGLFVTHLCTLIITIFAFSKQKIKDIFIVYSLIYSTIIFWLVLFGNLSFGILEKIAPINYVETIRALLMYCSQVALFILCYVFRCRIKEICNIFINENITNYYVILFSIIPDILNSCNFITYQLDDSFHVNIIRISFILYFAFCIFLFMNTIKKSTHINILNNTLIMKNDELKKIKNDYGLQIICLHELCNMRKYNDIKKLLKGIINNNNKDNNANENDLSLLSLATKHARSETLSVIVEDNADFKLVTISEIEIYRIVINIVNNAIRAMKEKGTLIAKSFQDLNNIIVTIENDGERIPGELIDKIFDSGFTTKNNEDEGHGYGLSIAKELIEKHYGKIFVESDYNKTKFTITLPKRTTLYN